MVRKKEPKRKLTNREIIESKDNQFEHAFMKFPRERLIPVTKKNSTVNVLSDWKKIERGLTRRGKKDYMHIHTHPSLFVALPSYYDLVSFEESPEKRVSTIAVRDQETGELAGYTMIFKEKKKFKRGIREKRAALQKYFDFQNPSKPSATNPNSKTRFLDYSRLPTQEQRLSYLRHMLSELRQGIRFHPARGYYFDDKNLEYRRKQHNLEGVVGSILIGFIFLILLIKTPISGAVISNLVSSNYQTGFFVAFGLLLAFLVYFILKPYKKFHRNP